MNIILEGDSKLVVEAVNTEGASWSSIGHLIEDIKIMLQNFLVWLWQLEDPRIMQLMGLHGWPFERS